MTTWLLIVDDAALLDERFAAALSAAGSFELVGAPGSGTPAVIGASGPGGDGSMVDLRPTNPNGDRVSGEDRVASRGNAVVVLRSPRNEDPVRTALDAGAHAYVSRSDGLASLRAVLDEVLGRKLDSEPAISPGRDAPGSRRREGLRLTPRQERVLTLTAEGLTYREIGARLFISESTVRFHIQNLKAAFGARKKTDLIAKAILADAIAPSCEERGSFA